MGILYLETDIQAALWEYELVGQISDGRWENSQPYEHWKVWASAEIAVDPEEPHRDFFAEKDSYSFTSSDLLSVIGNRMEVLGRLVTVFGCEQGKILMEFFNIMDDECGWRGPPEYNSAYYSSVRKALSTLDLDLARQIGEDKTIYDRKSLLSDLRAIKRAIKFYQSPQY